MLHHIHTGLVVEIERAASWANMYDIDKLTNATEAFLEYPRSLSRKWCLDALSVERTLALCWMSFLLFTVYRLRAQIFCTLKASGTFWSYSDFKQNITLLG